MEESTEKRGPVEKSSKGWPINPFGVIALIILTIIAVYLIGKPLISRSSTSIVQVSENSKGGEITSPKTGEIINNTSLTINLNVEDTTNVEKVQFWAKTYAENNWEVIGEAESRPYTLSWQIPSNFQNKAVAITAHIFNKDGEIIKDPGGWVEGVIILSNR